LKFGKTASIGDRSRGQQGHTAPPRDLLTRIYARFTEGFADDDVKLARAPLTTLV